MGLDRSAQMSRIKGRNTKPEQLLRKALWARGARYRLHYRTPVGRPDIVFPGPMLAVFVDGCQWHGCPEHYVRPRSNTGFWAQKLRTNVERDHRQTLELERRSWRVLRFWEHAVHEELAAVTDRTMEVLVADRPILHGDDWRVIEVESVDPAIDLEERRMVELRDIDVQCVERRLRSTRKWKRRNS